MSETHDIRVEAIVTVEEDQSQMDVLVDAKRALLEKFDEVTVQRSVKLDTESELNRIVEEILGTPDVYHESVGGPEGPWHYGPLLIRRRMNDIYVEDMDGASVEQFTIRELTENVDVSPSEALKEMLKDYEKRVLEML